MGPRPGVRPTNSQGVGTVKVRCALHLDGPAAPPTPTSPADAGTRAHPGNPFCFRPRVEAGPAGAHQLRPKGENMPRGGETPTDPRP